MATARICAASGFALSASAARFSSRVAITERRCASESDTRRNRLSELATNVLPLAELAWSSRGDPVIGLVHVTVKAGYFRDGLMNVICRDILERMAGRSV